MPGMICIICKLLFLTNKMRLVMLLSLEDFQTKFIKDILYSLSQEEVKGVIALSLQALEKNKVHGYIISGFIETVVSDLGIYSPLMLDAQQWNNIKIARILLTRLRGQGLHQKV